MTLGLRVEVEIDLAGHPLVVEFGKQNGNEPQARLGIGEDPRYPGASSEFAVDPLQAIRGVQQYAVSGWKVKDGQTV
jgi:hypothetical protein